MRKALIIAAGLAVVALPAWSQGYSRDRDGYDHRDWHDGRSSGQQDSNDRGGRSMGQQSSNDRDDRDDHSMRDNRQSGAGGSARFVLRSGDTRLGVRCDENETMRACVDAALTLFDRVRSQANTSSPSTSTSTSSSPATPSTPAPSGPSSPPAPAR